MSAARSAFDFRFYFSDIRNLVDSTSSSFIEEVFSLCFAMSAHDRKMAGEPGLLNRQPRDKPELRINDEQESKRLASELHRLGKAGEIMSIDRLPAANVSRSIISCDQITSGELRVLEHQRLTTVLAAASCQGDRMTGDKTLSGGILLTAAQSMQGFSVDMRLREQANKESAETGFAQDGSSKTMQQAPASDNRDSAGTGR